MKLILTKIIYSFDMELSDNNVKDWTDQKILLLHERFPLNVRLRPTSLP